jgi:hypothetical protein
VFCYFRLFRNLFSVCIITALQINAGVPLGRRDYAPTLPSEGKPEREDVRSPVRRAHSQNGVHPRPSSRRRFTQ